MSPTDPQGLYDQKDKGKNGVEWGVGVSLSATVLRGMMRTREMAVGAAEGADWKGTLESVGLWEESDMSTGQGAEQLPEDSLFGFFGWEGGGAMFPGAASEEPGARLTCGRVQRDGRKGGRSVCEDTCC